MKAQQKKQADGERRSAARRARIVRWVVILAAAGGIGYGLSQLSNIAYDERDIAVVDFSDLTPQARRTALQAANGSRCTCGCGMTLAQCVSTDTACPLREGNIDALLRLRDLIDL